MRVALPASFLTKPLSHRGLHDAQARRAENSLSAFRAAVEAGYGIELDVQCSKDGQAMVFHDEDLDRLTYESGQLCARSAAELGLIAIRDSDDFIPTLPQVLALVAGRAPVLIEIKDQTHTRSAGPAILEAAVARAIDGYQGPVAVMSFNPHSVAEMARLAPNVARGLTTDAYDPAEYTRLSPEVCAELRAIPDYDRTLSSFISHDHNDILRARVGELKAQGAAILCWTVRSPAQEVAARRVAQNITFEGYAPMVSA